MTEIYSGAEWYINRSEPETRLRGEFNHREVQAGPDTRTSLRYALVTEDGQMSVYAANVENKLTDFVGRTVLVQGKLVDLSDEGYGQELWIREIEIE